MPEQKLKKRKITKKELEKKIKGSYCCIVGRSEYINEINKRLLAGADYPRVYSWLRKIGARIGKETIKKHSQHYLDPSINRLAKTNRDGTTTIKKVSKRSKKKKKKAVQTLMVNLKMNKGKTPIERINYYMDAVEQRYDNEKTREESIGQLGARGDKLAIELFKMAKDYHSIISERQSNDEYWSAELTLQFIEIAHKLPLLQDLKNREELVKQLKKLLLDKVVEEETLAKEVKRNVDSSPISS